MASSVYLEIRYKSDPLKTEFNNGLRLPDLRLLDLVLLKHSHNVIRTPVIVNGRATKAIVASGERAIEVDDGCFNGWRKQ